MLAAAPLVLALAACGAPAGDDGVASVSSGTAAPTASASASAPTDPREAQLKFAQCMREHGVAMKDPEPNGGIRIEGRKGEEDKIAKAQQACKHFMDAAIGDKLGKPDQKQLDRMLKFAQCMREHGIPMEDPGPDGRVMINIPPGTPEEKVKAAHAACKEFEPGGGPS
ncbi:hypothetical protein DQ384_11770 [Sphaerisporangium album]|uniref:Secreted protein n=2 Tax=Sphaerisporangium album TaxID=509200 RepID=A0A367FLV9_9ACTN|nr:hypothetical protein DQ384_11770 [Sphaerisporangium album]